MIKTLKQLIKISSEFSQEEGTDPFLTLMISLIYYYIMLIRLEQKSNTKLKSKEFVRSYKEYNKTNRKS